MSVHPIIDRRRTVDRNLIEEVTQRIVSSFNPTRIVLFGSHARGEGGTESDLDLMVEMETELDFYERIRQITSIFGNRLWPMDVLVYTPQEVERDKDVNGTMV